MPLSSELQNSLDIMKAERKKKVQENVKDTSAADTKLQDDISAFASQLGLTSGSQNGFNDADFRPEVATQPIGKKGGYMYCVCTV